MKELKNPKWKHKTMEDFINDMKTLPLLETLSEREKTLVIRCLCLGFTSARETEGEE